MTRSFAEKRAAFRALHREGCFVLPNPWDVGGARMLQHLGFQAVASTSAGYAWSIGRPDGAITADDAIEHLRMLSAASDLPVNADFESGFAEDIDGLQANVTRAVEAGVSGLSIEDRDEAEPSRLYDKPIAIERLRAARAAIDKTGQDVILVARTEGLLIDQTALAPAIDKLVAFAEAGADCLYAPGVWNKPDIEAMVRAVAPKPLNVLVMAPGVSVQELADLGVRRISVGGGLARVAWGAFSAAAMEMKAGSFDSLGGGMSGKELNQIFRNFAQ